MHLVGRPDLTWPVPVPVDPCVYDGSVSSETMRHATASVRLQVEWRSRPFDTTMAAQCWTPFSDGLRLGRLGDATRDLVRDSYKVKICDFGLGWRTREERDGGNVMSICPTPGEVQGVERDMGRAGRESIVVASTTADCHLTKLEPPPESQRARRPRLPTLNARPPHSGSPHQPTDNHK
jgi:hypothetical protein